MEVGLGGYDDDSCFTIIEENENIIQCYYQEPMKTLGTSVKLPRTK